MERRINQASFASQPLLDLCWVRCFVTVAQYGSVTEAAKYMALSQAAASLQLKKLEEVVGTKLVQRTSHGVSLTPAGARLLPHSLRLLETNREALFATRENNKPTILSLGVPAEIIHPSIPRAVRAFKRSGNHQVNVVTSDASQLQAAFEQSELDIVLSIDPFPIPDGRVLAIRKLVWLCAQDSESCYQRPLPIIYRQKCEISVLVENTLRRSGISTDRVHEARDTDEAVLYVAGDEGLFFSLSSVLQDGLVKAPVSAQLPKLPNVYINLRMRDLKLEILRMLTLCLVEAFSTENH
ncbi:transcriptional regulator, LysR family protein [Grimontia indica]|uniref:Transcriptional regulator, LysR family protein n=1 Tax=Grimontia indica TaxID=1056512 RepID=R1IFM4_9GAMM|nr:transcriptional regulator, LysR family protein [Grimontia indica]